MNGLSPRESSELRLLVGRLSARLAHPARPAAEDIGEVPRIVDLLEQVVGPARTQAGSGRRDGRGRINLLLIDWDERRVKRLGVRRWPVAAATVGAILLAVTTASVFRDYAQLRGQQVTLTGLNEQLASNEAMLARFGARVQEISDEIASWRAARIVEPPRPDGGPRLPAAATGLDEEITRLSAAIGEEASRLRSLEQFVAENRHALTSLPSSWPVRGSLNSDFGPRRPPLGRASRTVSSPRGETTDPMSSRLHDQDPIPAR